MEFRYTYWKQLHPIAEHYVHSFARIRDLFEYDHHDPHAFAERAGWLDEHAGRRAAPEGVIRALLHYNQAVGNHPRAAESIEQLSDPKTLVVIGGQQAGLLTGPLLVIHKAISIIRTARRAAKQLGRPVVPVFWIAGEDHDFDEVNHLYALSGSLTVERIELAEQPSDKGRRLTVSRREIAGQQWESALSALEEQLQHTEFKPGWTGFLREAAAASRSLTDMFARVMARLFGEHGLVLLDSDDPQLRSVEAPMFGELIAHNAELERALAAARSKQQSLGFEPSADVREGGANLFWIRDGERVALHRSADGAEYRDQSGALRFSPEQLTALAASAPERFSNNVFTRPIMQDYLFPVLTAVLGPGEIAYWGLVRGAFRALGMQMPIIAPRLAFTLVEGTVKKQMDKLGLSVEEALFHIEEKREQWLAAQDSLGLAERFADAKRQFDELYAPVLQLVASINPGLRSLGETNRQKIAEQIEFLETRAKDAFESQFDAARRQFERIRLSLLPLGKGQERVYNVFAYLNKYGTAWLAELIEAEYEEDGRHIVVYL